MRLGLSRSEFQVHHQPIIYARSREIVGAEALYRWHHPEHGLIAPARFIPLAESSGPRFLWKLFSTVRARTL